MNNLILVVGSVNMDIVIEVEKLPAKGETVQGKTIRYVPGGKGANQAIAASRLGGKVAFIGKVGQDTYGKQLYNFLHSENLILDGLGKSSLPSGQAIITVGRNGANTLIDLAGCNEEISKDYIKKNEKLIKKSKIVVSQYEIPLPVIDNLFSIAKKFNKTTILNPSPASKTPSSLFAKIDYLVVNETELSFFANLNETIKNTDKIIDFAKKLLLTGPKAVIVTLGAKGSLTVTRNRTIKIEGLKVKTVDTTAAGDCFVGAFAAQINNDVGLEKALNFANRAAAFSVQRWGASTSLPTISELEAR